MRGNMCPNQASNETEAIMVFSPFKPYWKFDKLNGSVQNCWMATDCLFEVAGESQKQQFAATALVMGLIPMTIKDIAWPERRLIFVTKRLPWAIELLVLALGLVPIETNKHGTTRDRGCEGTMIAKSGWAMHKKVIKVWIFIYAIALMVCYASLTVMEIYSKRSALGCLALIFIAAWHIVALAPAAIHSFFAKLRRQRYQRKKLLRGASLQPSPEPSNRPLDDISELQPSRRSRKLQRSLHLDGNDENDENDEGKDREKKIASAVQGTDLDWPVQMGWGVVLYRRDLLLYKYYGSDCTGAGSMGDAGAYDSSI
jgi:hypothetical protein